MQKAAILLSTLFFVSFGYAEELVFSDGDGLTYRAEFMDTLRENQQYSVVVNDDLAEGLLFFDPIENSFKATIFQNPEVWGYTLEGQWTGSGSAAYGASSVGRLYQTRVFIGPARRSADKTGNLR